MAQAVVVLTSILRHQKLRGRVNCGAQMGGTDLHSNVITINTQQVPIIRVNRHNTERRFKVGFSHVRPGTQGLQNAYCIVYPYMLKRIRVLWKMIVYAVTQGIG